VPNRLLISFLLCTVCGFAQTQKPTLSAFKAKYLNQRIVIGGHLNSDHATLESWAFLDTKAFKKGNFESTFRYLPASSLGREATLIAIRISPQIGSSSSSQRPETNALGENLSSDDQPIDGELETVVRFDDGSVAIGSDSYAVAVDQALGTNLKLLHLALASETRAHAQIVNQNLSSVIGKDLYIPGYAWMYPVNTTVDEIADGVSALGKRLDTDHLPLLQPSRITAAKYLDKTDLIVLKVTLADGNEALAVTEYRDHPVGTGGVSRDIDDSFLGRIAGQFLTKIPSVLTTDEVKAIQGHEIVKGMSRTAIEYMKGRTSKESTWGDGGTQLVYDRLSVFLDGNDRVINWVESN
jgi:hypothetical protein